LWRTGSRDRLGCRRRGRAVTVPADARPLPGDAFKARRLKGMVSTLPDLMDEEAR
jgi:hypothetical protein